MFRFTYKRVDFLALLLMALLSGFCAGPVVESAEGEASGSEIEEVIFGKRQSQNLAGKPSSYSSKPPCHKTVLCFLRIPRLPFSENSTRNGFGAPLTL